jgi:tRNA (guanine-N7-)-methyltransferase
MINDVEDGDEQAGGVSRELRSFGRRKGRPLSPRQRGLVDHDLPRLSIDLAGRPPEPLTGLFPAPVHDVWLEIGFGGGEHLIWQASRHPDVGLIGCEPFLDGVVKVVDAVVQTPLVNVCLHPDDARALLRWLPDASLGRAFVLFPDPWPKKRHQKRRLVGLPLLDQLARVMRPGAELRVGTDISDYVRSIMVAVTAHPAFAWPAQRPGDWQIRPEDWPETRYEQKAIREGRRPVYLSFRRR